MYIKYESLNCEILSTLNAFHIFQISQSYENPRYTSMKTANIHVKCFCLPFPKNIYQNLIRKRNACPTYNKFK